MNNLNILPDTLDLPRVDEVDFPSVYFKLPTVIAAVGTTGSGKTYNLCLWNKWMFEQGYFTRLYCITPTYETNLPLHTLPILQEDLYTDLSDNSIILDIIEKINHEREWYFEIKNKYNKLIKKLYRDGEKKMDKEDMYYIKSMQNKIDQFYQNLINIKNELNVPSPYVAFMLEKKPHVPDHIVRTILGNRYTPNGPWYYPKISLLRPCPLLFIDDAIYTPIYSLSPTNPLVNLTMRHRHLDLSIEFATQAFKSQPKILRQNTKQFMIFRTKDMTVLNAIYDEIGAYITKDDFMKLYTEHVIDRNDFLIIDTTAKDVSTMFRKGWDIILTPTFN